MDVTSDHLEFVVQSEGGEEGTIGDPGNELTKRVDNFGWPVGKGAFIIRTSSKLRY
jgi:DNA-directed RNA polymerase II subunit RPB3